VDLPVRQAGFLWPLRAATLVLVIALLFDPPLPFTGHVGSQARWVLLDASLSMTAGTADRSPWARASTRARDLLADGWRVVTFGDALGPADTIPSIPDETGSRLAPALIRVAESGAQEILVLSDLRIEDAVAVRAALEDLGVSLEVERMGGEIQNAGVYGFEVEDRVDPRTAGTARVEVHGGVPGDSLRLEVLEEDAVVASAVVEAPGPGLRRTLEITLPPASSDGLRRFEARLASGADAFALDDTGVAYARIGSASEGGVVVISVRPDWEPRSLLPTLARTTGLTGSGYLRAGPDLYLTVGRASDRTAPVDTAAVRAAAERASLLVLHGLGEETDDWVWGLAARAPRLIAFVTDAASAAGFGLVTSPPRAGEWYLSEETPPSPLSGVLRSFERAELPPLSGLLVTQSEEEWVTPLTARLRGTGPAEAPLRLRAVEGRREALVLARGFWRWAGRDAGRDAYEALWAGVAGWLLREPAAAGAEVRPARRVVPRGERVSWLVPAQREGARVMVQPDSGAAPSGSAVETALTGGGAVYSDPLEPGPYRYAVFGPDGDSLAWGRFEVASGTRDMLPAPVDPSAWLRAGSNSVHAGERGSPLRTSPWPYLLILALLLAEWIGRRRVGLR
jgi:hypothetical protein